MSNEFKFTGDSEALIDWVVAFNDQTLRRGFIAEIVRDFVNWHALRVGDWIVRDDKGNFTIRRQ